MSLCKDVGRKHTGCILAPICFITNADHWQWYVFCGEMVTDWAKPQLQIPLTGSITCTLLFDFSLPCPIPSGQPCFPFFLLEVCKLYFKKKKKKKIWSQLNLPFPQMSQEPFPEDKLFSAHAWLLLRIDKMWRRASHWAASPDRSLKGWLPQLYTFKVCLQVFGNTTEFVEIKSSVKPFCGSRGRCM